MNEQAGYDAVTEAMVLGLLNPAESLHGYVCLSCGAEHDSDGWHARQCACGGFVVVAVRPRLLLPVAEAVVLATLAKRIDIGRHVNLFAHTAEEAFCMSSAVRRLGTALHNAGVFA
jgi:hypothetical protein